MSDPNKKVLVVEDDDMLRSIEIDQINKIYTALPARDGEEALAMIRNKRPDIIILDLLLPKLDGFEVMEKLRAMADKGLANIPIVVVSNLADPFSMSRAKQYNIEAYFTKTDVNLGILINRIDRIFSPLE